MSSPAVIPSTHSAAGQPLSGEAAAAARAAAKKAKADAAAKANTEKQRAAAEALWKAKQQERLKRQRAATAARKAKEKKEQQQQKAAERMLRKQAWPVAAQRHAAAAAAVAAAGLPVLESPVDEPGCWVLVAELPLGKKSYGGFRCPSEQCDGEWVSAHAFNGKWQQCQRCETEALPEQMWRNDNPYQRRDGVKSMLNKPHHQGRCQACREFGHGCWLRPELEGL